MGIQWGNGGGSNGITPRRPHFTEPKYLFPKQASTNEIQIVDSAGTATNSSGSAFFTELATRGAITTSSWTNGVSKQIVSLTGPGQIAAIIGPLYNAGTRTTKIDLVIDGVTYTTGNVSHSASYRLCCLPGALTLPTAFTTANHAFSNIGGAAGVGGGTLLPWQMIDTLGVPVLQFESSFVCSLTFSETTAAIVDINAGVMYRQFGTPTFT